MSLTTRRFFFATFAWEKTFATTGLMSFSLCSSRIARTHLSKLPGKRSTVEKDHFHVVFCLHRETLATLPSENKLSTCRYWRINETMTVFMWPRQPLRYLKYEIMYFICRLELYILSFILFSLGLSPAVSMDQHEMILTISLRKTVWNW